MNKNYGTTDEELVKLRDVLEKKASGNIAPVPIGMMLEDGEWTVDVHVHIRGVTEYDITNTSPSLPEAISSCTRALAYQGWLLQTAEASAKTFHLTY